MARPGITYAQVAQSAEALTAAGTNPTIAAIRQAMGGTGSPNTIHKHLSAWKGERPAASNPAAAGHELPAKLIAAIHDVISKAAANARAETEAALQQAQAEGAELARAGEYIEAERDALLEQIEALKTERDQAQAVAAERAKEIERKTLQIEQEQENNKKALGDLARTKSLFESLIERTNKLQRETEGLRQEITLTVKERQEAHERTAVMGAELKAAERRATEAESRETATAAKLNRCEEQEKSTRAELQQSQIHTQAQQIALDTAARELGKKPAKVAAPKKTTAKKPAAEKLI